MRQTLARPANFLLPGFEEFLEGLQEGFGQGQQRRGGRGQRGFEHQPSPEPQNRMWEQLRADKEALEEELAEMKSLLKKLMEKKRKARK